jgi:hypothetical protein
VESYDTSTPVVMIQEWCPSCNIDAKNLTENPRMVYCNIHRPDFSGDLDDSVEFDMQHPGLVTGGKEARDFCKVIHRDTHAD